MSARRRSPGEGGITERAPGVWQLQVSLPAAPGGRRRRKSVTFHGTKTAARAELERLRAQAGTHRLASEDPRTFAAAVAALLALADVEPSTRETYRRTADRHLAALGRLDVAKITPALLDEVYRRIAEQAGPHAAQRAAVVVRRALDVAVRYRWVHVNAGRDAAVPKVKRRPITPPDVGQVRQLLETAEGRDLAVWLRLAALTGARRGELVALRWSHVDLDGAALTIRQALARLPGELVVKTPKSRRPRVIALDPATVAALAEHRRRAVARSLAVGDPLDADRYLFARDHAGRTPWPPDGATRRFRSVAKAAGVTGVRLHDLRHAHATELLTAGVDARTVAGRLGHARASTTLDVYAAFVPAVDRSAAERAAGALDQVDGSSA